LLVHQGVTWFNLESLQGLEEGLRGCQLRLWKMTFNFF